MKDYIMRKKFEEKIERKNIEDSEIKCSLCGIGDSTAMIVGPRGIICSDCIDTCNAIMAGKDFSGAVENHD